MRTLQMSLFLEKIVSVEHQMKAEVHVFANVLDKYIFVGNLKQYTCYES